MIETTAPALTQTDEQRRLLCLRSLAILDTPPGPALDALTRAVAAQLGCPISLVSLVDEHRQWFKAHHGLADTETPREWAFCDHALADGQLLEVPDARADARFADNPLVTGEPGIRFYAGAPLIVQGQAIGTLCAIDRVPRRLAPQDRQALTELAAVAVALIERNAAQRCTQLNEARLDDMVRAASDFLWEIDTRLCFTWVSAGVEALLGVCPASLLGRPIWNPLLLDSMGAALVGRPTLHQRLRGAPTTLRQFVELPATGVARPPQHPVLMSGAPVLGPGRTLLGWRGTAKDAAPLLEGARRSRELEARLTHISALLPGAIFVLERHDDGRLRLPFASERLRQVFGLAPEDATEDAMLLFARAPAEQQRELLANLQRSAESGDAWTFECSLPLATPVAERWIGGRATPTPWAQGRQVWYGYAADFSARRTASQAMAATQHRLQQAMDVGRLGVFTLDIARASVVADSACCRLHGLAASAAGQPQALAAWLALIDPADHAALQDAFADTRAQAAPTELTYRLAGAGDAALIGLRLEASQSPGPLLGLCRDISAQERTARALRQQASAELAQQLQTEFLSRVSHELRTPMNAILGFVDLMRSDIQTPLTLQHRQWTEHVMSAGQRLMSLINDLLDLTRIDSGHHSPEIGACSLLRLIDSSQGLLLPLAKQKQVSLLAPTGKVHLQVLADPRGLGQVLINVFANAIKFNAQGGRVTCHVQVRGEQAVIDICDEGPGIAVERRGRLFQPFERLGRAQSSPDGSGLGLAISLRLMQAMKGRISALFPAQGGTCISIELPLAGDTIDTVPGDVDAPAPPDPPASAAPRRAIYADDNPVNALLLKAMFAMRSDWTLDSVAGAAELRAAVAETCFALVILDIYMGNDCGLDLLRELRQDPSLSGVRFVALSADSQPA